MQAIDAVGIVGGIIVRQFTAVAGVVRLLGARDCVDADAVQDEVVLIGAPTRDRDFLRLGIQDCLALDAGILVGIVLVLHIGQAAQKAVGIAAARANPDLGRIHHGGAGIACALRAEFHATTGGRDRDFLENGCAGSSGFVDRAFGNQRCCAGACHADLNAGTGGEHAQCEERIGFAGDGR